MKRKFSNLDIERGSENIFADIGLENAPELKNKAHLASRILAKIDQEGWNKNMAAQCLGATVSEISKIENGQIHDISLDRLFAIMSESDRIKS